VDLGPAYVEQDSEYNRLESAFLCEHNDVYYLFYSGKGGPNTMGSLPGSFAHFEINYLVSDHPTQGWEKPRNHALLEEWCCASEHPTFDGTTYAFFLVYELMGDRWRSAQLSDPKRIAWLGDGTVAIHECRETGGFRRGVFDGSFEGWIRCDESANAGSTHVSFQDETGVDSVWVFSDDGILANGTNDCYITSPVFLRDGAYEARILVETESVGSLVIRSTRHATSCYLASLDYGRGRIGFYRKFHGEPKEVVQERPVNLKPGEAHELRVVTTGEFFEIYLDGSLSIVRAEYTYGEGCWGFHADGPGVRFTDICVEELIPQAQPPAYPSI
jgi:hypothetical protein